MQHGGMTNERRREIREFWWKRGVSDAKRDRPKLFRSTKRAGITYEGPGYPELTHEHEEIEEAGRAYLGGFDDWDGSMELG